MTASGEVTAGKIVEAGRQFIMRRGYSGFSYADVADAISIRKASIHHHFPAKADLVIAVVQQTRARFDAEMASLQANGADSEEQLRAYVHHWEKCIADDSEPFCVVGMLAAELPALPDEVAQEVRGYFDNLAVWLEHVLELGAKGNKSRQRASVRTEAAVFVSMVYGAMLTARAFGDATLFRKVAKGAIEKLIKSHKDTGGE